VGNQSVIPTGHQAKKGAKKGRDESRQSEEVKCDIKLEVAPAEDETNEAGNDDQEMQDDSMDKPVKKQAPV